MEILGFKGFIDRQRKRLSDSEMSPRLGAALGLSGIFEGAMGTTAFMGATYFNPPNTALIASGVVLEASGFLSVLKARRIEERETKRQVEEVNRAAEIIIGNAVESVPHLELPTEGVIFVES